VKPLFELWVLIWHCKPPECSRWKIRSLMVAAAATDQTIVDMRESSCDVLDDIRRGWSTRSPHVVLVVVVHAFELSALGNKNNAASNWSLRDFYSCADHLAGTSSRRIFCRPNDVDVFVDVGSNDGSKWERNADAPLLEKIFAGTSWCSVFSADIKCDWTVSRHTTTIRDKAEVKCINWFVSLNDTCAQQQISS